MVGLEESVLVLRLDYDRIACGTILRIFLEKFHTCLCPGGQRRSVKKRSCKK